MLSINEKHNIYQVEFVLRIITVKHLMPKQVFAHRVQLEIISTGNFKRIILHITLIPWKDSVHLAWITVMPAVDRNNQIFIY